MKEKILIQSFTPNTRKFIRIMAIIGLVFAVLGLLGQWYDGIKEYGECNKIYKLHKAQRSCGWLYEKNEKCDFCQYVESTSFFDMFFRKTFYGIIGSIFIFGGCMAFAYLVKFLLASFCLTVTDKRIHCKTLWINHTSLPLDSITAVSKIEIFNVLLISSPSGRIAVSFVKNANDIYDVITNLIIARQDERISQEIAHQEKEKQANREAEEKARREANEKFKREAEEKARQEVAREKAMSETEEQAKRKAEEEARREATKIIDRIVAEEEAKRKIKKPQPAVINMPQTLFEKLEYALKFQTDDGMISYLQRIDDQQVQEILKSPKDSIRTQVENLLKSL